MNQDGLVLTNSIPKEVRRDCESLPVGSANYNGVQVDELFKHNFRQVVSFFKTMKGAVQVGARVGYHFYFANLKFSTRIIQLTRIFAAEIITNNRRRQSLVGHKAMLNRVTQIDVGNLLQNLDFGKGLLQVGDQIVTVFHSDTQSDQ